MRTWTRTIVDHIVVALSCIALGAASVLTAAVTPAAPQAFDVPGTNELNPNGIAGYLENVRSYYLTPFTGCTDENGCEVQGINYPAQFWPVPGWGFLSAPSWNQSVSTGVSALNDAVMLWMHTDDSSDPIVLFGYSQGARVVSLSKEYFASNIPDPKSKNRLQFGFIGNISRPNGGAFSRLSALGYVPIWDVTYGHATPTDLGPDCTDGVTPCTTTDIALEFDGVSDSPNYLFNVAAMVNAAIGLFTVHPSYLAPNGHTPPYQLPDGYLAGQGYTPEELNDLLNDPANQKRYGDTLYITIPTPILPIVQPLLLIAQTVPFLTPAIDPIVELISPILRWQIDLGYDRTINPGMPTGIKLFPIPFVDNNPFEEAANFFAAVGKGFSDLFDGVPPVWRQAAPAISAATDPSADGGAAAAAAGGDAHEAGITPGAEHKPPEPPAEPDPSLNSLGPQNTVETAADRTVPAARTASPGRVKAGNRISPNVPKVPKVPKDIDTKSIPGIAEPTSTPAGHVATGQDEAPTTRSTGARSPGRHSTGADSSSDAGAAGEATSPGAT